MKLVPSKNIEIWGGGPTQKKTKPSPRFEISFRFFSLFFVWIASRYKNRRKTKKITFIFVTNLRLTPYIVANTSKLGV